MSNCASYMFSFCETHTVLLFHVNTFNQHVIHPMDCRNIAVLGSFCNFTVLKLAGDFLVASLKYRRCPLGNNTHLKK